MVLGDVSLVRPGFPSRGWARRNPVWTRVGSGCLCVRRSGEPASDQLEGCVASIDARFSLSQTEDMRPMRAGFLEKGVRNSYNQPRFWR